MPARFSMRHVGRNGRHHWSRGFGLLVVCAVALIGMRQATRASVAAQEPAPAGLVGAWIVTSQGDTKPGASTVIYHGDGTLVLTTAPIQPFMGPPELTTHVYTGAGMGSWTPTGSAQYTAFIVVLSYTDTGDLLRTLRITTTITLESGGDAWTSVDHFDVTDADGNARPSFDGSSRGTRITIPR